MIATRVRRPAPVGPCSAAERFRFLDDAVFLRDHASGTLRKAAALGFAHQTMLLEERTAFEWGWGFQCVPATRVTVGMARIEADCAPLTEAAWHIHRIRVRSPFPDEDTFEAAYLTYTPAEGLREEGVGVVLTTTHAIFVPDGHLVFALIAPLSPTTHTYLPARNPC
jgi:hypothetical protein